MFLAYLIPAMAAALIAGVAGFFLWGFWWGLLGYVIVGAVVVLLLAAVKMLIFGLSPSRRSGHRQHEQKLSRTEIEHCT